MEYPRAVAFTKDPKPKSIFLSSDIDKFLSDNDDPELAKVYSPSDEIIIIDTATMCGIEVKETLKEFDVTFTMDPKIAMLDFMVKWANLIGNQSENNIDDIDEDEI